MAAPTTPVLALIDDRRVTQYWDPARIVSADIVRAVNENPMRYRLPEALPADYVAWDVVAVFGPLARWERNLPPPAYFGGPVVEAIESTARAIAEQLGAALPALR